MSRIPSGAQMIRIKLEIAATQRDLQHPSNIAEQHMGYSNHYTFGPNTMAHIQSRWKMTQDKKWMEINPSKDATQWENTTYWEQNNIGKWQCCKPDSGIQEGTYVEHDLSSTPSEYTPATNPQDNHYALSPQDSTLTDKHSPPADDNSNITTSLSQFADTSFAALDKLHKEIHSI